MSVSAFALTIAMLLASHASFAHQEAPAAHDATTGASTTPPPPAASPSATVCSPVAEYRSMFADVGQDLARELEHDFDRELDAVADELLLLLAAGRANSIITHRHGEGDDPRFPPLLRDQEIKTLLEALDDEPHATGSTPATPRPAEELTVEPVKVVALLATTNDRRGGKNTRTNRKGSEGRKRRRGRSSRRTSSRRRTKRGQRSRSTILGGETAHHGHIEGDQIEGFSARGMAANTVFFLDDAKAASNPSNRLPDSLEVRPTVPRTAAVAATPVKDSGQNAHRFRAGARPSLLQSAGHNKQKPRVGWSENYVGGHSRSVRRSAGKASAPRGNTLRTSPFLVSAVIGTALVIGMPAQRPLVLITVMLLHATAALARAFARFTEVRISNRVKGCLSTALKAAVALALSISAYNLTMAVTQPLLRLIKDNPGN